MRKISLSWHQVIRSRAKSGAAEGGIKQKSDKNCPYLNHRASESDRGNIFLNYSVVVLFVLQIVLKIKGCRFALYTFFISAVAGFTGCRRFDCNLKIQKALSLIL